MDITDYLQNQNDYVTSFIINEKNKSREIFTYLSNQNGENLRSYHSRLLLKLDSLPSSKFSFAYKHGQCTKDALLVHSGSKLFIKMDIHSFFESINFDKFIDVVGLEVENNNLSKEELKYCFYQNHLILGFITSPKISDLYLYNFDLQIEDFIRLHPNLRYSRYCDDILISTKIDDFGELHTLESYIESRLKKLGLVLNENKTREFDLSRDNSVSFLGLNLSKDDDERCKITISKSFILKTLDILDKTYSDKKKCEEMYPELKQAYKFKYKFGTEEYNQEKLNAENLRIKYLSLKKRIKYFRSVVKSRIGYIKYNSSISYERFLKKHEHKFGFKWGTIWLQ